MRYRATLEVERRFPTADNGFVCVSRDPPPSGLAPNYIVNYLSAARFILLASQGQVPEFLNLI